MIIWDSKIDISPLAKQRVEEIIEEEAGKEKSLELTLRQHKKKRTLDANAYYWRLVGLLGKATATDKVMLHNLLLRRYGALKELDDNSIAVMLKDSETAEKEALTAEYYHLKPTASVEARSDGMYRTYLLLKGSSEYETDEMGQLIDGVISECRECEIPEAEIASDKEWEQLEQQYGLRR